MGVSFKLWFAVKTDRLWYSFSGKALNILLLENVSILYNHMLGQWLALVLLHLELAANLGLTTEQNRKFNNMDLGGLLSLFVCSLCFISVGGSWKLTKAEIKNLIVNNKGEVPLFSLMPNTRQYYLLQLLQDPVYCCQLYNILISVLNAHTLPVWYEYRCRFIISIFIVKFVRSNVRFRFQGGKGGNTQVCFSLLGQP